MKVVGITSHGIICTLFAGDVIGNRQREKALTCENIEFSEPYPLAIT